LLFTVEERLQMNLRALVLACSCFLWLACGDDTDASSDGGSAGTDGGVSGSGSGGSGGSGGTSGSAGGDGIPDGVWGCDITEGGCSCAMRVGASAAPPGNFPEPTCTAELPCCYVRNLVDDSAYWQCFCNLDSEADCNLSIESLNTAADSPFQKAQRVDQCPPGSEGGGTGGAGGSGGEGGGGSGGAGGSGGGGSGGAGGGDCEIGSFAVELDGTAHAGCVDMFHAGGLNHVIAKLEDGHTVVVNFGGQVPADDVCELISLREPDSTMNDWNAQAADCVVKVTTYGASGERAVGTFSATLAPGATVTGTRELMQGSFDVAVP
jgi:hypothetical protein